MRRASVMPAPVVLGLALLGVALASSGCPQESPEDRVAELRSRYTAELSSFAVQQVPLEEPPGAAPGEAVGEGAPEAAAAAPSSEGGLGEETLAPVPTRTDVTLDILLQNRAVESLPGITLDITQVDAAQNEKHRERVWMDTSGLLKGRGQSYVHRLEDVDYQEGDGFHVEVRHPIPPAERGDYRELAEAGKGG